MQSVKIYHLVAGIVRAQEKVLFVEQQAAWDIASHWALPGGIIEHYESISDALQHEVREETGFQVLQIGPLAYITHVCNIGMEIIYSVLANCLKRAPKMVSRRKTGATQPRRAADAAGASVTWVRFTRKARPPLCVQPFFPQPAGRRLGHCWRPVLLLLVSFPTPASGAANAWALGCRSRILHVTRLWYSKGVKKLVESQEQICRNFSPEQLSGRL
jgi:ADP-ribose pyrophosphatase YjhB (NUDIX family)